ARLGLLNSYVEIALLVRDEDDAAGALRALRRAHDRVGAGDGSLGPDHAADAAVVPAAPDEAHGRAGRRLRQAVDSRSMRRTWIGLGPAAAVVFFSAVILAVAQPAARVARIGYLTAAGGRISRSVEALRLGLRDLGYVEGQHYVIEARAAGGQLDRVPGLAAELVRLKVDVIVAAGPQAAI